MNPQTTPKILFIHNLLTPFVRYDLELLRQEYMVTELCVSFNNPATLLAIPKLLRQHDLLFGWFASAHTLLPLLCARFWGKPTVLVIGGYDVANMPEISYGNQRGGLRGAISSTAIRLATILLPFSNYSLREVDENIGHFDNIEVAYLGVPDKINCLPEKTNLPLILSVGNVDQANLWRKGHEPFVRAAALLPDYPFVLVGKWKDDAIEYLRQIATPNVTFTGRVDDATLHDYYRRASVYVQASQHEGFGMSVAEAMLAGCIPAVTRAGALPEVVGVCGTFAVSTQPSAIAAAIQQALAMPAYLRADARQRILDHFPLQKRGEQLVKIINRIQRQTADHQLLPTTQR